MIDQAEPLWVIPLWADLVGVALGGLQGALFASGFRGRQRLDWLGVAIIGIMIGMGGGFIRDLLLGQAPATLQSPWYLVAAGGAAFLGMWISGLLGKLNRIIVFLDAIVIGMFGAFGTSKALAFGVPILPAIFIGMCAAVGGGMARDVSLGLPVAVMHVSSFYAVAAIVGCSTLAISHAFGLDIVIAVVLCIVVTAVVRVLAVIFDISLPEQMAINRRKVAIETTDIPVVHAHDVQDGTVDLGATGAIVLPEAASLDDEDGEITRH
ncbi:trimeric intracellular cation channel family protein [Microbacterium amylolyticum]|uniref:Membrane protein YeiH n=1 Tax=Microbacterium amylolyticum TaxID=936337 RepID=A0ABS4ZED6_9MICO|nr:TRIC cation channel family protein [Microbacterium amylolyticum]MBP2435640.1 putative membrane protein YeiH [Microbacterium amylolyticum]